MWLASAQHLQSATTVQIGRIQEAASEQMNVAAQAAQGLESATTEQIERLQVATSAQMNSAAQAAQGLNLATSEQIERMQVATTAQMDAAAQTAQDLQSATTEQVERIHEATATQMRAMSEAIERQLALLDDSLPRVIGNLDRAASLVGAATNGMDDVVNGLGRVTTELNATSSNLGTMLSDSIGAVEDLARATASAAASVTSQQGAITQLAARAVDAADQLRRASELFGGGFDGLQAAQKEFLVGFRARLEELAREMSGWLSDYADQVTRQTSLRMSEWDGHTEKFTSTMITAAQALSDAVDDLASRRISAQGTDQS